MKFSGNVRALIGASYMADGAQTPPIGPVNYNVSEIRYLITGDMVLRRVGLFLGNGVLPPLETLLVRIERASPGNGGSATVQAFQYDGSGMTGPNSGSQLFTGLSTPFLAGDAIIVDTFNSSELSIETLYLTAVLEFDRAP